MHYIEAVSYEKTELPKVFLAGGISNCPDWQSVVVEGMKDVPVAIFNPRRKIFPITDVNAGKVQIEWEFEKLREADIILFWFSSGSLNPIVLFEFGAALERDQKLVVGLDPAYERIFDVRVQMNLRRPDLKLAISLEEFIGNARLLAAA